MRITYDVIEIDNHVILSTLQNLYFGEHSIFVYRFGLEHTKPNIGKIFNNNSILIRNILILIEILSKSYFFIWKMIDLK